MENIIIKHLKDKDKKNFENSKRKESCQIQEILNEVTRTSHQELWRPGGSGQPIYSPSPTSDGSTEDFSTLQCSETEI